MREAGFGEPALFRFHGDAIETLLALGQHEEATALLAELEEQGTALQRIWALTVASRCRALLSAAGGEIERAYDELERALELHDRLAGAVRARTHTPRPRDDPAPRARKKRAARESLERALAVFEELGAVLWSEKARAELARIGGRAPASGALTPTEERVAALVAAGRTYREVADALFISPKTVQWNLSKIYRKLGVRSRGELAAKLAAEGGSPGDIRRCRPAVKVQQFRRFPSSSSRANTGDSADFAAAPAGVPSIQVMTTSERSGMYPQVTQFETRERLLGQELQLLLERHSGTARRERPSNRRRLFGLAFARALLSLRKRGRAVVSTRGGVVCAILTAAIALAPPGAAGAESSATYSDPVGDAGRAPDIASVTLTKLDSATLGVTVELARPTALDRYAWVLMGIDTDRNQRTGGMHGSEAIVFVNGEKAVLYRRRGRLFPYTRSSRAPSSPSRFSSPRSARARSTSRSPRCARKRTSRPIGASSTFRRRRATSLPSAT